MKGSPDPSHSQCFLHNVILELWRPKQEGLAHREARQKEAGSADSSAGQLAAAKSIAMRASGLGNCWPGAGRQGAASLEKADFGDFHQV